MSDEPKRIEYFNTLAGLMLAQLYDNFPVPKEFDLTSLAKSMDVECSPSGHGVNTYNFGKLPNGDFFYQLQDASRAWLLDEGFIRLDTRISHKLPVLTGKALAVMNATPPGLSGAKSLGSQLSDAARGAGRSATNAAIGDLVGQAIGMAAGIAKTWF